MFREWLSFISRRPWLRKGAMSTPILRDLAWHFVAGESQEDGLEAVRSLDARGIRATMNFIGTHVHSERDAVHATDTALECLRRIRESGLDTHLSLKLTQIGLDISEAFCRRELGRVLERAHACGQFARIDMEESAYTGITLSIFEEAHARFPGAVGIVLQSYLRRNRADLERLTGLGAPIRLVKGGYWESERVAFRKRAEIDAAFLADMDHLIRHGQRPALATHDPAAIAWAVRVAREAGLPQDGLEFQVLFGVREDLALDLVGQGYRVRSYVPYGAHWYEYVLGCIRRDPGRILRRS